MYSALLSVAVFGTSAWAAASSTGSVTPASSSTSTVTSTVPAVGQNSNGPEEFASSYCFPSSWTGPATDTPCYSMEVLNQACFYGPSVFETATATPSASASPQDQQSCYCDQQNGVGYMYFEFMSGCSTCFRDHGSLGGPGAFSPNFISSLSSAYCAQPSPTAAFGKFLTSFAGSTAVETKDLATSTLLGTSTDVGLYFTTVPTGGVANQTANGTAAATTGLNSTTSVITSLASLTTASSSSSPRPSTTASATATQSGSGASAVQLSGFFGAMVIGIAAML